MSVDPPPANLIRSHGVETFLDLLPTDVWLFPNRTEGEILTEASKPNAIVDRLALRFEVGALTLGLAGSLAWAGNARSIGSVTPLESVDTTGAGDAFAGAFVAAFLESRDIDRANAVGCGAARDYLQAGNRSAA